MLDLRYSVTATLATLLFAITSFALANDEIQLEEVVVTATKSKTNLSDAPAAVTIINDQQILAKNTARLGDALLNVPSLFCVQEHSVIRREHKERVACRCAALNIKKCWC